MKGDYTLNAEKKDLWKMGISELQSKLVQARRERMELETKMYTKSGTSNMMRNYPIQPEKTKFGNLKRAKKRIAVLNTILRTKLQTG